jgi:hypothetical protein
VRPGHEDDGFTIETMTEPSLVANASPCSLDPGLTEVATSRLSERQEHGVAAAPSSELRCNSAGDSGSYVGCIAGALLNG